MQQYLTAAALCLALGSVSGANILMMTLGGTKSHKVPFLSLGQGLVSQGHRVTLVSAFPPTDQSPVEEVAPLSLVLYVRNFTNWDLLGPKLRGEDPVSVVNILKYSYQVCDAFYSAQETRQLLSRKVDLLMLDGAYPECMLALVHHFGVPFIYLNTVAFYTIELSLAGSPSMFSVTPYFESPLSDRMNFWERTKNAFFHLFAQGVLYSATGLLVEPVVRKHFGSAVPSLHSIGKNVSLILQHGHHSVTYPRPYLPGVVEVACIHCRAPRPLSEDLERFVNGGGQKGFIYVSFGTSVKTTHMPEVLRLLMVQVFSELPYQVLWKYQDESDSMPDLPDNVRLASWLPQQDLLGHPKILAFVSHGGLHSTLEAVYHAVPMVTLPIFCDQGGNAFKAARDGYAVRLDLKDMNTETFLAAINKVINTKTFKESAKYRSKLLRDQPEPPIDRAIYWVNYILRHRGAYHLHSPAKDLTFAQYFMLDIIAALLVSCYVSVILIKFIWSKFLRRKSVKKIKTR